MVESLGPEAPAGAPRGAKAVTDGHPRSRWWQALLAVTVIALVVAPLLARPPVSRLAHFERNSHANIAHGGAQGHAPANTLEAFALALEMGADTLETDLQITTDEQVVLHHDGTVDAQTDGHGAIADMTLAQVQQLDAGYRFQDADGDFPYRDRGVRIPTLDEVLVAFPDAFFIVELKTDGGPGIVDAAAERIVAAGAERRVVVASFSLDYLRQFRALLPGVATNMPESESRTFFTRQMLGLDRWWSPPGGFLQVPEHHEGLRVVTPGFVAAAERRGVDVQVWTVNDPDDMHRMLAMGVHGIITDHPDRLAEVIAEREAGVARGGRVRASGSEPVGGDRLGTVRSLQERLGALTPTMQAVTRLGDEEFYLLVFPLVYWSVSPPLGVALGVMLLLSSALNESLKLALRTPRPSFLDPSLGLVSETTPAIPSGHAQNGVAVWGLVAAQTRRRWVRVAVVVLVLLLGYSRVHLGVHFVEDVMVGWLVGGLLLLAFLRLRGPVSARLSARSPRAQVLAVLAASLALVAVGVVARVAFRTWQPPIDWIGIEAATWPIGLGHVVTPAGALFGLGAGVVLLRGRGGFDVAGSVARRALRSLVGLVGVLVLWRGLAAVFPAGDDVIALVYRYLRYALVGLWVSGLAPLLFVRLGLAATRASRERDLTPPAPAA